MDWTFMPFVIWRVPTIMEGEIFIQWVEDPLFNDNEVVHRVLSFPLEHQGVVPFHNLQVTLLRLGRLNTAQAECGPEHGNGIVPIRNLPLRGITDALIKGMEQFCYFQFRQAISDESRIN